MQKVGYILHVPRLHHVLPVRGGHEDKATVQGRGLQLLFGAGVQEEHEVDQEDINNCE